MLSAVPVHWDHDGAGPLPGILLPRFAVLADAQVFVGFPGTEHYRLGRT